MTHDPDLKNTDFDEEQKPEVSALTFAPLF
jgi:hypothetical protein